ncbi:hypothetical protein A7P98_05620 [Eikenella sp. NML080894]|nr:hypothetical protein A7P98_05620 [Eikenella sp. NML080894]
MQTQLSLSFRNISFDITDIHGQPWLRGYQIGNALEYSDGAVAIAKLYDRNADEFTDSMTQVIDLPTAGGKQQVRVFSLRGCHLLGMLARTKVAKEFRRWVLDVLEKEVSGSPNPKTTVDDRTGLRQAVSALVGRCGIDYSSAYNMVHQRFGVAAIEDIPAEKLNDAVQYVHTITLCGGISGEVLDRLPENLQPKPLRNLQGAVINSLYCAEFIYRHRLALRGLNRRLAATLNDHAADSIMFLRNVAEQAGINVPSNEYFQYFPWDGDSAEKASYHQLNA